MAVELLTPRGCLCASKAASKSLRVLGGASDTHRNCDARFAHAPGLFVRIQSGFQISSGPWGHFGYTPATVTLALLTPRGCSCTSKAASGVVRVVFGSRSS